MSDQTGWGPVFRAVQDYRAKQEYDVNVLAWLHAELKYQIQSGSLPAISED